MTRNVSNKHNKRRNIGLVYEFLVRYISAALVEGASDKASVALNVLKKHFKPGTELYREFRLVNSLMKVGVSSPAVASSILSEAKFAARSHDVSALDREKSLLLRDINHKLNDESFWDQPVSEYRMYATVQSLVNDWRNPGEASLTRVAQYEDRLVRWLSESRDRPEVQEELAGSVGENRLLFKLMSKRLNEKYDLSLTPDQRVILREYLLTVANGKTSTALSERLESIRESTLQSIDAYFESEGQDSYLSEQVKKTREMLLSESLVEVNDGLVTRFMLYLKLADELGSAE